MRNKEHPLKEVRVSGRLMKRPKEGDAMTRLTEKDIFGLEESMGQSDLKLTKATGLTIRKLASLAAGITEEEFCLRSRKVAVIPITSGEGIIPYFTDSVRSIISYLGYPAEVMSTNDVAGIYEAVTDGKEIIFMADDQRFIAFNLRTKTIVDNGEATARGYVAALNSMSGGLNSQKVLVVGAGEVGRTAIFCLRELGANVEVYEINPQKVANLEKIGIKVIKDIESSLQNFQYILDASPQAAFLDLANLHPEVMIAAPGIPLGLTPETYLSLEKRVVHDPLQIGVATMLALAII